MTSAQRIGRLLRFDRSIDRLPMIEWAPWWDKTVERWIGEGLPADVTGDLALRAYWGLDRLQQFWFSPRDEGCPVPAAHGAPLIRSEADYEAIRPHIFTDRLLREAERDICEYLRTCGEEAEACWFTIEGFFWFPRTLLGIENHLYAFYDQPELMHRINRDLCAFNKRLLEMLYGRLRPAFMTFAEDMSYNLGPMISRGLYDAFLLPYYRELVPLIQAQGTRVFIDSDGNVEPMIPWFLDAGIEGALPLERMAGVDVNRIRAAYPRFLMIGGFDKTVMHEGEAAMRAEFERLLPVMRTGGYIPSVDHQTPPDVDPGNLPPVRAAAAGIRRKGGTGRLILKRQISTGS